MRQRSLNPRVAIMVGGPMLAQDPHLAATLGADFSSGSADQALRDAADQVRMHRERQVTQARSRGVSRG